MKKIPIDPNSEFGKFCIKWGIKTFDVDDRALKVIEENLKAAANKK